MPRISDYSTGKGSYFFGNVSDGHLFDRGIVNIAGYSIDILLGNLFCNYLASSLRNFVSSG